MNLAQNWYRRVTLPIIFKFIKILQREIPETAHGSVFLQSIKIMDIFGKMESANKLTVKL